jgi:RNA polymerase I-specific transcription initiation factor RRN3
MLLTPDETLNKKETSGKIADYKLPKCTMPSPSELQPVEAFVMNAIQSKHNEAPDPSHTQGYKAIIDALRRPVDPPMLRMVLISLRTAGSGTALNLLTTHASTHAQLIHWVFRFNATIRPNIPHDEKNENLCGVVYDGSLLDAHLHLILAMVSARTVNLIPALTAVWRMLAENIDLEDIL